MIAWNNVWLIVEIKSTKNNLGDPELGPKLGFPPFSQASFIISFPQGYSLERYLTSNRTKTSKKNSLSELGSNRPKSGSKGGFPAFSS